MPNVLRAAKFTAFAVLERQEMALFRHQNAGEF
jgi:hypothetical protein